MILSNQTIRSFLGHDSPEAELLLCCARTSVDSHQIELIKSLVQKPLNWYSLLSLATRHGVVTLLYWNLNSVCPELVPAPELHKLREYFRVNSLRNKFLEKELVKLLHLFQTHEIPAIPFKGPVLASIAYGNLSLRSFADLDILVQKRDLGRAYQVLRSQDGSVANTRPRRKAFDGWPALRGEGIEPFGRRGRVSRWRFYLTFLDHCHDFNAR